MIMLMLCKSSYARLTPEVLHFTSVDELEEIDIGPGERSKPTYVSAKLDPEYK